MRGGRASGGSTFEARAGRWARSGAHPDRTRPRAPAWCLHVPPLHPRTGPLVSQAPRGGALRHTGRNAATRPTSGAPPRATASTSPGWKGPGPLGPPSGFWARSCLRGFTRPTPLLRRPGPRGSGRRPTPGTHLEARTWTAVGPSWTGALRRLALRARPDAQPRLVQAAWGAACWPPTGGQPRRRLRRHPLGGGEAPCPAPRPDRRQCGLANVPGAGGWWTPSAEAACRGLRAALRGQFGGGCASHPARRRSSTFPALERRPPPGAGCSTKHRGVREKRPPRRRA